jgi:hypothetical protein
MYYYTGHWAPLTSWTDDEWDTYNKTGNIPTNYDPFKDLIWYK